VLAEVAALDALVAAELAEVNALDAEVAALDADVAAADAELADAVAEFAAEVALVAAAVALLEADVAEVAAAATCASAKSLRTASEEDVGVARFVILNPPALRSVPNVALEYVPPDTVAVDVNVPLIVAPAIVGVLIVGDVKVLPDSV